MSTLLPSFTRPPLLTLVARLREPRRYLQVVAGPRQVGKTTLVLQALERVRLPSRYASADEIAVRAGDWIATQWDLARAEAAGDAVLVLDEVQKVPGWSESVKRLWDEDSRRGVPLRVVLLGSSPLLVGRGLTESLAGRFETIRLSHWGFSEMHEAFGMTLDEYVFFGGYPGAASLIGDEERWRRYVLDSLVETVVARDVLLLTRVDKPALLRQLFALACAYSGQVLSYTKMLGQLHEAGNTTTLAHYLELLGQAGLVVGLQKYSGSTARRRGSSPKLLALNTALVSAVGGRLFTDVRADGDAWGRLVETAVGDHLVNAGLGVTWWREGNDEVDYVVRRNGHVSAIEVKSGHGRGSARGLAAFAARHGADRRLVVGEEGIPIPDFLASSPDRYLA
jgi:predicted AAA+ superfamily ATPase